MWGLGLTLTGVCWSLELEKTEKGSRDEVNL